MIVIRSKNLLDKQDSDFYSGQYNTTEWSSLF